MFLNNCVYDYVNVCLLEIKDIEVFLFDNVLIDNMIFLFLKCEY